MIGFKTEVTLVSTAQRVECNAFHRQVKPSSQYNDPIRNRPCPDHIINEKGFRQCKKKIHLECPKPQRTAEQETVQLDLCVCQYLTQHVYQ